jgi:hypothetical protein
MKECIAEFLTCSAIPDVRHMAEKGPQSADSKMTSISTVAQVTEPSPT